MKVASLQNRVRTVAVTLPDELGTIRVTYRAVTRDLQDQLKANEKTDTNPVERLARDLSVLVTNWDVADEAGQTVAPTFELLSSFDMAVLNAISGAITEHMYPPKGVSATSGAGS